MGVEDEPDRAGAKPKSHISNPGPASGKANSRGSADRDVGASLRSVYQKTVEEQIPDEFLDLLGKLQ